MKIFFYNMSDRAGHNLITMKNGCWQASPKQQFWYDANAQVLGYPAISIPLC